MKKKKKSKQKKKEKQDEDIESDETLKICLPKYIGRSEERLKRLDK